MNKILNFLRTFQNSPLFANLALHAWAGAFTTFFFGVKYAAHRPFVVAVAVAVFAFKEFFFDHRYEIPAQSYRDGAQDFYGYMIGIGFAIGAWVLV